MGIYAVGIESDNNDCCVDASTDSAENLTWRKTNWTKSAADIHSPIDTDDG